ncbi:MAG TPA: hypothetical protein PKV72_06715 [Candidatus Peribacteria bacterium]|nr:hypothetical protein [Candidatus Peribacteria bacterium]
MAEVHGDLQDAMEAALVPECWQLPEALRGADPVEIQVGLNRKLALELLTGAELPGQFADGGYGSRPADHAELAAVVERITSDDTPHLVRKRSRFFRTGEPWTAVRRTDMPPTTGFFRPGADTFVGDIVRLTAPGEPFTEEAAVITIGRIRLADEPQG